ncbi:protein kinase domain-containing protein [Actinocorallia libanotica]|uniref:protein kinase domain-containing protein n=1 Tax=Actinocorallia libanotica TaxID=46162 RepID=UPI0031D533DB
MRVLAGRYALEEELGRGGMGVVHRATDLELGRGVAVKLLPGQFVRQPGFLARFQREARLAAALSHPHIAVVHDIGQDDDTPYLVMELVAGRTMTEAAGGAAMAPERVASVADGVLDALEHCHARGIVHRDIKPSNIMLDESGTRSRVKVMDFGIARLLSDTATRLTASGMLIGTPAYLSPEQAEGKDTLPASDLYSLGCVLYELLTGRPPFTGDSPTVVLLGHLQRTPEPPSALRPGLAPEWDGIVMTALAKAPEDRYASAAAMRAALRSLPPTAVTDVPPPAPALAPTPAPVREPARSPAAAEASLPSPPTELPPIPLHPPAPIPPNGGHGSAGTGPNGGHDLAGSGPGGGHGFAGPGSDGGYGLAGTGAGSPTRRSDAVWVFFAGVGLLFAVLAGGTFVVVAETRHAGVPEAASLLLVLAAAAAVVRRVRRPAAALLAGTLPAWPFWIIWESFRASPDPLWIVSYSCALAAAGIGGALAIGGGLARRPIHPLRPVWAALGSLAGVVAATGLLDFHPRLFAPVLVACAVTVPVIGLSAFLRSPWATVAAAAGWLAAVPLYSSLMLA